MSSQLAAVELVTAPGEPTGRAHLAEVEIVTAPAAGSQARAQIAGMLITSPVPPGTPAPAALHQLAGDAWLDQRLYQAVGGEWR